MQVIGKPVQAIPSQVNPEVQIEDEVDECILNMDGSDVNIENSDYKDSLHYKISQAISQNKQFTTRGQKMGVNKADLLPCKTRIKFGETSMADYGKLGELGKGTYGEVNKAVHKKTK